MALSLLNLLKHCFPSVRTRPSISVRFYSFFFGKNVVQLRRDPFHEATGLSVSHNTSSGFLTWAESESAMATARQHNLIGTHISAVRPNTFGGRERGNGKNGRRGAKRGAGRGSTQLRHPLSTRTSATPSAPPLTSSASQ